MFYIAGTLGLASMIRETGLTTLLSFVPNGAPVLFTPMAAEASAATGFHLF